MRNLHVVIASIGRVSCSSVAGEAVVRETRLARLTIVGQGGGPTVDRSLQLEADRRGVELKEVVLPRPVGPAMARHIGTMEGDEEFVGFLDDDITFERGSLSDLVEQCERNRLGGASGVLSSSQTSPFHRLVKTLLFRSIFRDPRPRGVHSHRPVPSNLLSGGMTVYRRALYAHCARAWTGFPPGACGEDVELSFSVSRHAALVVDPSVRVRNRSRNLSVGPADPTPRAMWHLDRYRSFASRHATTRRHWLAYGGVLAGILVRGVGQGAGAPFARAVMEEAAHAAREVGRLPSRRDGRARARRVVAFKDPDGAAAPRNRRRDTPSHPRSRRGHGIRAQAL